MTPPTAAGSPKGFAVTTALSTSDPAIDPTWPKILLDIRLKTTQIDEVKAILARLMTECDELVIEAVDDGERYRDIGAAANRSMPWVQSVMRRVGHEGPRVRILSARAAAKKRDENEEDDAADLFLPDL